jgi:hypothetical protein
MSGTRVPLSAWVYLCIAAVALVDVVVDWPGIVPLSAGLTVLFLCLEIANAPPTPRIIGLALIGFGLAAAGYGGQFESAALDGFARSKTFVLLFFAVAWLQIPARESPALKAAREVITRQPPGRRFLVAAFGVHTLGSVLNLAGLSLVATMIDRKLAPDLLKRLTTALMLGFTSASSWSPFYVSMVVVLTALPTLQWIEIAPYGFMFAMISVFSGFFYDRIMWRRGESGGIVRDQAVVMSSHDKIRSMGILGSLAVLVVGLVEVAGISIPVALGLVAPPFALIWTASFASGPATRTAHMRGLVTRVISGLPALRNEVLVFVGATVFGVGVSVLIPADNLGPLLDHWLPSVDVRLACLTFGVAILSMIGLHPVIVVILVGEVLPPEILGAPDWIIGLALLAVWGLSTMISPYSATTLYLARVSGVSAYAVAWRWNLPFVVIAISLVTVGVIVLRHMTL